MNNNNFIKRKKGQSPGTRIAYKRAEHLIELYNPKNLSNLLDTPSQN